MTPEVQKTIAALNDQDALVAARALMTLLDLKLAHEPGATRPPHVNPANLDQVVASGGASAEGVQAALTTAGTAEAAAAARGLLLASAQMGYAPEVLQACQAARVHVRDLGLLSGPVIVAALAAVVAWVPYEKKKLVKEHTAIGADGGVVTTKEVSEETKRVGAKALEALASWWKTAFSGDKGGG
jgi:hypothetical protein